MSKQSSLKAPENWWEDFFEGLAVQLWLEAVPAEHTEREAERIAAALALPAGAEMLDVPCGGGRLALALAARGHRAQERRVAIVVEVAEAVADAERAIEPRPPREIAHVAPFPRHQA